MDYCYSEAENTEFLIDFKFCSLNTVYYKKQRPRIPKFTLEDDFWPNLASEKVGVKLIEGQEMTKFMLFKN